MYDRLSDIINSTLQDESMNPEIIDHFDLSFTDDDNEILSDEDLMLLLA
jgi:hypothetical protein